MNIIIWLLLLMFFSNGLSSHAIVNVSVSTRPEVVNIGALISFDSMIGNVARIAINAAVEDVNSDPSILRETRLKIAMQDTKTNDFLGIVEAFRFMENNTVAIIGPQFSVTAHVISHIANELQVPLLSFAATDPTLAPLQFPFFVRTTHSDAFQMAAVADLVGYYEWSGVVVIYVDDDFGRNGISKLGDKLAEKRVKISYKAPLSPEASKDEITRTLIKVSYSESRIIIIHTYPSWGLKVLSEARNLQMMETGYVWIATDWLSTVFDTEPSLLSEISGDIQGVLTLRMHTPDSKLKTRFLSRWSNLTSSIISGSSNIGKNGANFGLNMYGLYAYDSVWLLATAINSFFDQKVNFSFSNDSSLTELGGGNMKLDSMRISEGGKLLLQNIVNVDTRGVTGPLAFNSDMDLIDPAYEVINIVGSGISRVGYWSNSSGLSTLRPEAQKDQYPNSHNLSKKLYGVLWPGKTTQKPRGWVFPNNGKQLRIGVPNRVSFGELITGFCIDVFTAAVEQLQYGISYKFISYGGGRTNPSTDELVKMITKGVFDAVVGDVTITTNRMKVADFTQPYVESGLIVVAPIEKHNSSAWAFLRPFTFMMWCVTGVFFLIIGAVIWILERRTNEDFRGPPNKQLVTIIWFGFSTLFSTHRERTSSTLARFVMIIWLFVVLVLNSSYTASLTSILTVEQLSSRVKGIESLVTSGEPIGYVNGSFAGNYLTEQLGIRKSRLVPLKSQLDYEKALKDGPSRGGVAAVVDERAYMELFLSTRCEFSIVGQEFTKMGWGFAFPRDSPLAIDISTAIMKLVEKGDLQRIHDKWLTRRACSSEGAKQDAERLQLKSFWGLFLLSGLACLLALIFYLIKMLHQFSKRSARNSQSSCSLRSFLAFVNEKEEVPSQSKRRRIETVAKQMVHEDGTINYVDVRVQNSGFTQAC